MNNQQIRCFIAIELPDEVKAGLHQLQAELKLPGHTFVKWVAPESVHITLKFLGNIDPEKVTPITRIIEQAGKTFSPFQLETGEVGAFPNLRQPRVLWLSIRGELDKLIALQQRIDDGLTQLQFAKETREFTPHLTLARLRQGTSPRERREFGELVMKTPIEANYNINVDSISLMKSQLLPSGAVYSRLSQVRLTTEA